MSIDSTQSLSESLRLLQGTKEIYPKATGVEGANAASGPKGQSFSDFLMEHINDVNTKGIEADKAIDNALLGKEANPHATMIALQKADISFRLMMTVKDRLIEAYQQIARTPIG